MVGRFGILKIQKSVFNIAQIRSAKIFLLHPQYWQTAYKANVLYFAIK
jgi:hypothetical protein